MVILLVHDFIKTTDFPEFLGLNLLVLSSSRELARHRKQGADFYQQWYGLKGHWIVVAEPELGSCRIYNISVASIFWAAI